MIFLPASAVPADGLGFPTLYVRAAPSASVGADIRRVLTSVDSRVPITTWRPLDTDLELITWISRMMTLLLTLFAGASLLIAAIGQDAAMAFAAQRRTRELAIRLALGATSRQVSGEVLREGLRLTAVGLVAGLALGALVGRLAQGLLYGTSPADPISRGSVALLLAVVSVVACYVPAWRAARVNPLEALRQE